MLGRSEVDQSKVNKSKLKKSCWPATVVGIAWLVGWLIGCCYKGKKNRLIHSRWSRSLGGGKKVKEWKAQREEEEICWLIRCEMPFEEAGRVTFLYVRQWAFQLPLGLLWIQKSFVGDDLLHTRGVEEGGISDLKCALEEEERGRVTR